MANQPPGMNNPLIAPVPAQLTTARGRAADGTETALLMIHTPAGTTVVHLAKSEALEWAAAIAGTAERMAGLVTPPGFTLPPLNGLS